MDPTHVDLCNGDMMMGQLRSQRGWSFYTYKCRFNSDLYGRRVISLRHPGWSIESITSSANNDDRCFCPSAYMTLSHKGVHLIRNLGESGYGFNGG